jgi:hypothetical protein
LKRRAVWLLAEGLRAHALSDARHARLQRVRIYLIDQVAAFQQGASVEILYTPVSATVLAEA